MISSLSLGSNDEEISDSNTGAVSTVSNSSTSSDSGSTFLQQRGRVQQKCRFSVVPSRLGFRFGSNIFNFDSPVFFSILVFKINLQ